MTRIWTAMLTVSIALLAACGETGENEQTPSRAASTTQEDPHHHEDGDEHAHDEDEHAHGEEQLLGSATVDGMKIEAWQGHGPVTPGAESHLILQLPYSDKGATTVRAWIGSSDPTVEFVGKGTYDATSDDYDIHAEAPAPLSQDAKWWFELTKPDGTKSVGSLPLLRE